MPVGTRGAEAGSEKVVVAFVADAPREGLALIVKTGLRPEHFHVPFHRKAVATAMRLGSKADVVMIAKELERQGEKLAFSQLQELQADYGPHRYPDVEQHAREVKNLASREAARVAAADLELAAASSGPVDPVKTARAQAALARVAEGDTALEQARTLARGLPLKATEDAGAPLAHEALDALLLLERLDPAELERTRAALKGVGVSLGRLDRALKKRRRADRRARDDEEHGSRPVVLVGVDAKAMVDAAEVALAELGVDLFHRAGELVRVVVEADQPPRLVALRSATAHEILSSEIRWEREGDEGPMLVEPPRVVVEALLARETWPRLRRLAGVVPSPALRADGTVVQAAGYDQASGLLVLLDGDYPRVPDTPTKAEALTSLSNLEGVFRDFPFVAPSDKAAALSLLLTIVARSMVNGPTPLFAVRAAERGTGKSLLVRALVLIATGAEPPVMSQGTDATEEEKRLVSLGLEQARVVLLDNIEKPLGSEALSAALTSRTFRGRILGSNRTATVEVPILVATGNNLLFKGDTGRRVVPVDLVADVENPEERSTFEHPDLLGFVRMNRRAMLSDALTILRWGATSKAPIPTLKPLGSYENWSETVRATLVRLGAPDPCLGRARIMESSDPQREADCHALKVWFDVSGNVRLTVAELVRRAGRDGPLSEALAGLDPRLDAKNLDSRRVGYALRRIKDRILGGLRLRRVEGTKTEEGAQWRVEEAAP